MNSLSPDYIDRLSFSTAQLAAIQGLGEARGRQDLYVKQAPEQLEALRQNAIIESSESSNRIEGVTAAPGRVAAIVLKSSEPRNRSEQEIAGYRDALQLIHESHEHIAFTANVVLQFHGMLFRYLPSDGGRWKAVDNEIVQRSPDGGVTRIRFKPTSAVATPQAMEDLVANFRNAVDVHNVEPLVVVPLAILDFLCIHPFRDGNGRTARLLALLLLYHFRYRVGRYISLERIIEESRETYYDALEASSRRWHEGRHDAHPWLNYFWGALTRAYWEFEERVGTLIAGKGSKTKQIRAAVARRLTPFAISEIEADCPGVSREMVRVVLRQMKLRGEIAIHGRGRGAKWRKSK